MNEQNSLIMLVDDSRTMRFLVRQALEEAHFRVIEAQTGEDALILFKQDNPDAIVLDVEMPGMGGFETCKKIRALPEGGHIPIMMATAFDDSASINKAYEVGATDFITKPINWDMLGHRMRYIIRSSRQFIELDKSKTALQAAQTSIQRFNAELEQKVVDRTKQLQQTNEELKATLDQLKKTQDQLIESEKMASLGNLVTGIAHEVNTPIGISLTAVSHLQEKLNQVMISFNRNALTRSALDAFLSEHREALELLNINLQRAIELIKNFKQTSLDQASQSHHEFSVKKYLEEILFSLKPALKKTKIKTQIDCPENLKVDSYPGVLFHVITILVMNSVTHGYLPEQEGCIRIEVKREHNEITLKYSDDGRGIPEGDLKRVFEPFFTTKRSQGSLGLGLHIAYNQITQMLGGSIMCESEPGRGATFIITFPMVAKNK